MAAIHIGISGWLQGLCDVHHLLASVFASGKSLAKGVRP
jgi:hypothetical protein